MYSIDACIAARGTIHHSMGFKSLAHRASCIIEILTEQKARLAGVRKYYICYIIARRSRMPFSCASYIFENRYLIDINHWRIMMMLLAAFGDAQVRALHSITLFSATYSTLYMQWMDAFSNAQFGAIIIQSA